MPYHLKTRIAIAVSLLALGFMTLLSWLAFSYFEREFKSATFNHLADSLSVTADGISSRVEHALQTLETISAAIPVSILDNQARMQSFLDEQNTDLLTFDNGLGLFSPDGRLIAANPRQEKSIGMDFSFRDYIKVPLQTRQSYISFPFQSSQQSQHPIIVLSEPVIGETGEIAAILAGSFDLYGNNFLQALINSKVGEHGYYLMIDQRGTMVIHPQKENILLPADNFFPAAQITKFLKTSRGQVSSITMAGQEMIGSFQHVTPLDWTLIALSPLVEDFRPIHQARTYTIVALAVLSFVMIIFVRLLSNRLTSPLLRLAEKIRHQTSRQELSLGLDATEYAELGDLADSIQTLMNDVSNKRKGFKEQLDFLQNLIDTIPGPIFYKDAEYRYMGCNMAFENFLGIPRDQLIGKTVFEIAPADLAEVYHQADVELWQQGGEQVYEASVKYADGSLHDVIFYKKIFCDLHENQVGMVGTFLDITDRKDYERALLTSEKRFRLLVENAADAFYLHDEMGQIIDVNQQACSSLGYARQELIGMKIPQVSADFDLEAVKELQVSLKQGRTMTIEDHHRRKDGTTFPVEVRLCHTEQEGGMVIALARDISDRKQDQEKLQKALSEVRKAKEQVDNILRSTADGLVVTDRLNRVSHINHIAAEMLGVSVTAVINQPFSSLFVDEKLRQQARTFLQETDQATHELDFKFNLSDSEFPRIIEARSSMLRTESGALSGVVTLLRDVSRERELDQIKSEFISTAAHEMRTPMSVIMGYIEMLMDQDLFGLFSAEKQQEFLGEAYRKGEALAQIIDDLFDISRIEAGLPLPIAKAECDLNEILQSVVDHFAKHTDKHRFKIDISGQHAKILADCNKMTQVFENLISNAVKYSPGGGEIKVTSVQQDNRLRIDIEDQGSGMSAEQVARIFDKFYRADSSNTAVSGLGLGMSIVKAIVEGHEGDIWIESSEGIGTRVSLEIPCEM